MIIDLSFYTLARTPSHPRLQGWPQSRAPCYLPVFTHHAIFWVIFLLPLLHWAATCRATSGSWGFGCLSQGNLKLTKAAQTQEVEVWEWNVRHDGWQIFLGKGLNVAPLRSLHEMVELLVILKKFFYSILILLQWAGLFFIEKWNKLGFWS